MGLLSSKPAGPPVVSPVDDVKVPSWAKELTKSSKVFMDISVGDTPAGRVEIVLADSVCPKTTENFKQLCAGTMGFGYKNSCFHRVIPNFSKFVTIYAFACAQNEYMRR